MDEWNNFLEAAYKEGVLFKEKPEGQNVNIFKVLGRVLWGPQDREATKKMLKLLGDFFSSPFFNPLGNFADLSVPTCLLDEGVDLTWQKTILRGGDRTLLFEYAKFKEPIEV